MCLGLCLLGRLEADNCVHHFPKKKESQQHSNYFLFSPHAAAQEVCIRRLYMHTWRELFLVLA